MFCKECGNELDPGARFCRNCGKPVGDVEENRKNINTIDKEKNLKRNECNKKTEEKYIKQNNVDIKENTNYKLNDTKNTKQNKSYKKITIFSVLFAFIVIVIICAMGSDGNSIEGTFSKSEGMYGQHQYIIELKDGEFYYSWPEINFYPEPHEYTYDEETGEINVKDYNHKMYYDEEKDCIIYYSGEGDNETYDIYYRD